MQFMTFKSAIARQFEIMSRHELFRTAVSKDELWDRYLGSFPAGTNPIFRVRTEHDCSCCRQFIRNIGDVVAIIDNKMVSIWDAVIEDDIYSVVARSMAVFVKANPIDNIFLHTERTVGTERSHENTPEMVTTWDHLFVRLPHSNTRERNFVCAGADIGPRQSTARADHDVLLRSLTEITPEAIDTVLDLIKQNALYRGEEQTFAVTTFGALKREFLAVPEAQHDLFVWQKIATLSQSVSRFRNTAIGTLLSDLSIGTDVESAVKSFEFKVAPQNYKRTTALVTPAMVAAARTKIEELGLTSALERRYARLEDISINNLLFANRDTRKALTGDVFDQIATKPVKKNFDNVEEVPIASFISDILPQVSSVEVMFENDHRNNLVSLIAPVDSAAKNMFKWDNRFSWSYVGDMTDSIKERVKKAGGNVTGDLCCRLAWHNHDDLDLHMVEPSRYEIYFGSRGRLSPSGGDLDVDMNAGHGSTREPVENIFYEKKRTIQEGVYKLSVNQYSKRETTNVGFEVEIDCMGTLYRFAYDRPVGGRIPVVTFEYTSAGGMKILESLPLSTASKKLWNISTREFHQVNAMMMSPNYWDEQGIGNKHYFFMLDGCRNEDRARGFYNEFLVDELTPHRRVIEMVGAKLKTDQSDSQLSGLGFSSTQRANILVRVSGNINRTFKVAI